MMQSCRRGVGVVFKNTCSSYASTSRYTLDHSSPPPPPPLFEQLYPPTLSSSPTESKQLVHSPSKGRGRRSRRNQSLLKRRIESLNLSSPPSSPRSPLRPTTTRTTRSEKEEVSPYLPQITREKNFLLSQFRSNLHSHSHLSRSSSASRIRNRRNTTSNRSIEQTWLNFVKLLRYPSEELPILPQSHFPTSTSTTAREGEESGGRSVNNQIESSLFSLKELHELLGIFAKSRPKTRNGLHRLLIVTELISRHHPPPSSPSSHEGVIGSTSLQGGGRGLNNREWNQLFSFVGKSMRSVKPDPEMKSVLALYSQSQSQRSINSSSSREELKMYNTLLDLAQRSRMNELFDQILEKMVLEKGFQGDGATFSIRMKRELDRGTGQDLLFKLFKQGLESTVGGKRFKKQSRKVLWNCLVWSLAKKGDFEKVEKIYKAMKNREEVTGLGGGGGGGGEESSVSSLLSFGRPPLPDFSCYSSLIQAYCHYGQLKKSLLVMYEMIHLGKYSPTPQHFHQLFRAFVRFGESPPPHRGSRRGGYEELDWISLRGLKYDNKDKSFNSSSSSSPLSTVLLSKSQSSSSRRRSSSSGKPQVVVVEGKDEKENEFNLTTLQTIFESFLSIQPPLPSSSSSSSTREVFQGERTSPKPQTIYFLLKAFSKLGSFENEPEILLEIFEMVEKKFTNKNNEIEEGNSGSERKWKGWKMDKRVEKLVKDLRLRVEDREKRLKELM